MMFHPAPHNSRRPLLEDLLEQMLRPGFAYSTRKLGRWPVKLQSGKSARIVVTMGTLGRVAR